MSCNAQVFNFNTVISRVGFERPEYNTSEDDGSVEICAAIMEPADTSLLPADYTATFNLSLENGFAIGMHTDHTCYVPFTNSHVHICSLL